MNTNLSTIPITTSKSGKLYRGYSEVLKINCITCNKEIYRQKHHFNSDPSNGRYCSLKCKQTAHDPKSQKILNQINTTNFYYLLGLLATDGYINQKKRGSTCRIGFSNKHQSNIDLLYDIQTHFGGRIHIENKGTSTYWYLTNKEFIDYLISIGITNNKSLTLNVTNWFNTLKNEYKWAFIRGCWDGDGCLSFFIMKNGKSRGNANIVSASESFAKMIHNFIKESCFNLKKSHHSSNTIYSITLNCSNSLNLAPMYNDLSENDLYLTRKYKTFKILEKFYTK